MSASDAPDLAHIQEFLEDQVQRAERAEAELDRLRATIAAIEKALTPFARLAPKGLGGCSDLYCIQHSDIEAARAASLFLSRSSSCPTPSCSGSRKIAGFTTQP